MTCSIWPWHPLDSSKDFYRGRLRSDWPFSSLYRYGCSRTEYCSDAKVLGFTSFIQGLSVNVVGSLYEVSLVGDPDVFALV